jgi:hypothetical protein
LAVITASHQVIEQPWDMDAGMARHGRRVLSLPKLGKSDTFILLLGCPFNALVQWGSLKPDAQGMVHLSLAEFGL